MPIHTKQVTVFQEAVVRDVDAMEGMPITGATRSVRPGKWTSVLAGSTDNTPWAKTVKLFSGGASPSEAAHNPDSSGYDVASGGYPVGTGVHQTHVQTMKLYRLFAFNSTDNRMYSKIVINHPLQPGEEIEISGYINRGFRIYNAHTPADGGNSANPGGPGDSDDFIGIISCEATNASVEIDETAMTPGSYGLASTNKLTSFLTRPSYSAAHDTSYDTVSTSYRGDAGIGDGFIEDTSDGFNLGITSGGWQFSNHRNDNSYSQAQNSGGTGDETTAKLYRINTLAHPSQNARFFRITIRNDTQQPHYLAVLPYNPDESTYEYWMVYDLRLKVTSGGGSEGSTGMGSSQKFPALRSNNTVNMAGKRITGIDQIPDGSISGALVPWKRIFGVGQTYQHPHVIHISGGVDQSSSTYPHKWLNMQNRILKFSPDSIDYGLGNNSNSGRAHRGFGYLVQRAGQYSQVTIKSAILGGTNMTIVLGYFPVTNQVGSIGTVAPNTAGSKFTEVCRFQFVNDDIEDASAPVTSTNRSSGDGLFPADSILCGYVIPTDYVTDEFHTMSIVVMLS